MADIMAWGSNLTFPSLSLYPYSTRIPTSWLAKRLQRPHNPHVSGSCSGTLGQHLQLFARELGPSLLCKGIGSESEHRTALSLEHYFTSNYITVVRSRNSEEETAFNDRRHSPALTVGCRVRPGCQGAPDRPSLSRLRCVCAQQQNRELGRWGFMLPRSPTNL
ncbi:hypothetical protein N657DRAFT_7412 [Parathielavia appendiculata]|uniref:Uncharacterized protein n=1 Tax=Parathielavia appendiculata TaxID=2587402 RepID=A0AAN6U842_9PEZI|nr:hypothetical protein N657DRAFT_7412 [Parathielavia appendiculata]